MKGEFIFMKIPVTALLLLLFTAVGTPVLALDTPKPESIAEKMSFKLVRGVANFTTSLAELPKQTYLTSRTHGNIGYVVGPVKGFGMFLYRGLIGLTETIFFMVPQPGYYDPMIDPEFVWQGWEELRAEPSENKAAEQPADRNGSPADSQIK